LKGNRILDELVTSFTSGRSEFMALVQLWYLKAANKDTPPPNPPTPDAQSGIEGRGLTKNLKRNARTRVTRRQATPSTNAPERSKGRDRGSELEPVCGDRKENRLVDGRSDLSGRDRAPSLEMDFSEDAFFVPKPPLISNGDFDFDDEFSKRNVLATPPLPRSTQSRSILDATPTSITTITNDMPILKATPTLDASPTLQGSLSCTKEGKPNRRLLKFDEIEAKEKRLVSTEEGQTEIVGSGRDRGCGDCALTPPPAGREGQQESVAKEGKGGESRWNAGSSGTDGT